MAVLGKAYVELLRSWALLDVAPAVLEMNGGGGGRRAAHAATAEGEFPWLLLDDVDLADLFQKSVQQRCLEGVPAFLRGPWKKALDLALAERERAARDRDAVGEVRAWKLFLLLPSLLLRRTRVRGGVGKEELVQRFGNLAAGRWDHLLSEAFRPLEARARRIHPLDRASRGRRAEANVRLGEVSKGRRQLTGAPLAPCDAATFADLQAR